VGASLHASCGQKHERKHMEKQDDIEVHDIEVLEATLSVEDERAESTDAFLINSASGFFIN
jgi:hypothetical protein